ncbi:hypothetical protein Mgra_00007732 [Meloidogyne graminicola]|uniref:acid phosphatase n=1 Tax=Meloidogyne graminicola TaxID=189291 RepID=A0A8S9ZHQ8_9BILA|nr:hypothetical protein Mgra_00007732 [Meloidogyne graminicola]
MSILANAQGMFSSFGQNVPNFPLTKNVPKNGITIKYLPKGKDPIVFDEVDCPAVKNEDNKVFESEAFKREEKANNHFLQFIAKNTDLIISLRNISKVHDPLTFIDAHQLDGFKLPKWANDTVRKEIFRLYNLKNSFDFKTLKQKRLLSGPLFTEILKRMENIALKSDSKLKFQVYSGHDGTVAGLLAIFGIYLEIYPTFSTAVLIELHQQPNNMEEGTDYFIRIFHKNETVGNCLKEIEIPECGLNCNLKQLREIRREFIIGVKEWKTECKNNNN